MPSHFKVWKDTSKQHGRVGRQQQHKEMKSDSKVKLIDEDGETIYDERKVKAMIEKFWVIYFVMNGDATYGSKKEIV